MTVAAVRPPAVAGSFYPADAAQLRALVRHLLEEAGRRSEPTVGRPMGVLVPHAGLAYSGLVAAAAWRLLADVAPDEPLTVVLLGTNHADPWLDGVAVWPSGAWRTPLGMVEVDEALAADVAALGAPFAAGPSGHHGEHSIEVQLPFLQVVAPEAQIVPLAVSAGQGRHAREAGEALGRLLARRVADGRVLVAISSDMAHYPHDDVARRVTETLLPPLRMLDATALATAEGVVTGWPEPGIGCGMCGIQPAVLGLAALAAAGATLGTRLLAATSTDAGGPVDRVVGYLAMRMDR